MAHEDLPQRTPGRFGFPCYPTTSPSVAFLIRVAEGLDEWAERDRRELENQCMRE
ncbi:hypothetical protein NONO_c18530 [Nocardia nova SH22a]|uniref:Uncharacterized protein n=1 Tax=Nocardia nova SH22a TaxID=1415166 RepID=W5TCD9_9NOCA|nr:hypothetical protein NONO_c18530 [Nocardia nova SH22a]